MKSKNKQSKKVKDSEFAYIYKTEFVKMGKWNLLPSDSETWHTERTSGYFRKVFGFGKGSFIIHTLDDDFQHPYFPKFYIDKIYNFIKQTNQRDYKKLARLFSGFYRLKAKAYREIPKITKADCRKVSNAVLIKMYRQNRDWAARVAVYDQFGWIAEDYWTLLMEKILVSYGLKKDSEEYHRILFILTKPEEISTTLQEKKAVLNEVIKIKRKQTTLNQAAVRLTRLYGWLPCFTYGTPWDKGHYLTELGELKKKPIGELQMEFEQLAKYKQLRNRDFKAVIKKYKMKPKDVQIFVDFGLALDGRNEAEYIVSLCGFGLIPIYTEMAKRLFISIRQLRHLLYEEVIACMRGQVDPLELLAAKGKITGWVFNKDMSKKKVLTPAEADRFFTYLNKHADSLQGHDEAKGICASPGQAIGKAKILHRPSDGNKVKEGDILVAHVTTVDYLPAMKKAAAFVTEVGGLTCHAAVVAREFGVPCVVSLKNATKNFKDGQLIMVEADKGIVKKHKS
jgi:phosphohistidine swiveling domain-containing protein